MEANKSLLYLSYAVTRSDGEIQSQEDEVLNQIIDYEGISSDILEEFNTDVEIKSLEEMRKIGLESLMKASRKDQIKILAWVHKMIYADEEVNVKEAQFLMQTIKYTDISFDELETTAEGLPEID
jgi:uncharacterized tellurite resistance protein B-like protein